MRLRRKSPLSLNRASHNETDSQKVVLMIALPVKAKVKVKIAERVGERKPGTRKSDLLSFPYLQI